MLAMYISCVIFFSCNVVHLLYPRIFYLCDGVASYLWQIVTEKVHFFGRYFSEFLLQPKYFLLLSLSSFSWLIFFFVSFFCSSVSWCSMTGVSKNLLGILAVVCILSASPPISKSSSPLGELLGALRVHLLVLVLTSSPWSLAFLLLWQSPGTYLFLVFFYFYCPLGQSSLFSNFSIFVFDYR